MSVQPIEFTVAAKDLPTKRGPGGGNYSEIEVPGDYEVRLESVTTYDKTKEGKSKGWVFTYSCETPSGGSVNFDSYLSFGPDARWKIVEAFDAHGDSSEDGEKRQFDPEKIIGTLAGAFIDFPRDKNTGEPTSNYRGIERLFPLPEDDEIQALVPQAPEEDLDEAPFDDGESADEPLQL